MSAKRKKKSVSARNRGAGSKTKKKSVRAVSKTKKKSVRAVSKPKKKSVRSDKRKGREVYNFNLPKGASLTEIENLIADFDTDKFVGKEVVKIILLSADENGKDIQAVSHFYKEIVDPFEMNLAALDILYDVYFTPRKRRTRSEEEVARHKPLRIMFDFESVKNPGSSL